MSNFSFSPPANFDAAAKVEGAALIRAFFYSISTEKPKKRGYNVVSEKVIELVMREIV